MHGLAAIRWEERAEPRDKVLLRTRAIAADGVPRVLTVVNLSPGGLMARIAASAAVGERLTIQLPLIGHAAMEVRWALGGRIGGRFDPPIPADRYPALLAAAGGG